MAPAGLGWTDSHVMQTSRRLPQRTHHGERQIIEGSADAPQTGETALAHAGERGSAQKSRLGVIWPRTRAGSASPWPGGRADWAVEPRRAVGPQTAAWRALPMMVSRLP
jgi:hypothetical protein